ncbi:hypothetical protein JZU56_01955, partial [bacterium]|nr:hypothetical protein [bacterium]
MRFLGRDLTDDDVPHAYHSRKKNEEEEEEEVMGVKKKANASNARKKREERRPAASSSSSSSSSSVATIVELSEGHWNDVRSALENGSPWGLFSSLLAIVEVAESANVRIPWVAECATRLEFLCDDAATTTTTTMT